MSPASASAEVERVLLPTLSSAVAFTASPACISKFLPFSVRSSTRIGGETADVAPDCGSGHVNDCWGMEAVPTG